MRHYYNSHGVVRGGEKTKKAKWREREREKKIREIEGKRGREGEIKRELHKKRKMQNR